MLWPFLGRNQVALAAAQVDAATATARKSD